MKSVDLFVGVLYAVCILFIGIYYANRKFSEDPSLRRNFILSLSFKLVSAIVFGCLYQFYYTYGDCIVYYQAAKEYLNYLIAHPASVFDFIFLDQQMLNSKYRIIIDQSSFIYDYFNSSNIFVHKTVLFLGVFGAYLFFPVCVLFSLISFTGCWKIYRTLSRLYPEYEKYFRISFLYLPSLVFWTSGIGKDAICVGFINLFASLLIEAYIFKKSVFANTLFSIFFLYIVFVVKSYIVLSFVPLFVFFIYSTQVKKIKGHSRRILVRFVFFSFLAGAIVFLLVDNTVLESVKNEVLANAFHLTQGQQNLDSGNDSKYDLGITLDDIKSQNIKPYIISSIEVALFRPYAWEVSKPIILLSFVESCFFLLFTIYVMIKGYVFKTLLIIYRDHFVFFCILYSVLFAFFVGLVSANFGTLIRYKTPFIPYFLIALFIIRDKLIAKAHTTTATVNLPGESNY